jgi:hypothetical protein
MESILYPILYPVVTPLEMEFELTSHTLKLIPRRIQSVKIFWTV